MPAFDTQTRFQAALGVIQPGMNDAAVVGAGVESGPGVPLEHACRQPTCGDGASRSQPCHSCTDDCDVDGVPRDQLLTAIVPRGTICRLFLEGEH